MNRILHGLWLVSAVIFSACQKEVDSSDNSGPSQTDKLISKITYTGTDNVFVDSFEYDNQNRCTKYLEIYYDLSQGPNPPPYIWFYEFHYNGSETLPYKVTDTSQGRQMVWHIQYDGLKRKTVDSIQYFSSNQKQVSNYTYTNNRIISNTIFSTAGVTTSQFKDTFDVDANNCTRHASWASQGSSVFSWQYAMTYDAKINPLSKLNIAGAVLFGSNRELGDFIGLNKNNHLTLTYSGNFPNGSSVTTYQYTYDADGYPVSSTYQDLTDPTKNGSDKYEYKK